MTRIDRTIRRAAGFTLGLGLAAQALLAPPALAQAVPLPPPSTSSAAQALDPPGRVARLADTSGQVWLYTPDTGEWIGATRNQPLTSGDRLATDAGGRAELRIGSTTLRLDGGAELEVARLDDEHIALRLYAGSLAVRLRTAEAVQEFEVATTEGRFTVRRPGRYRVDVATPADSRGNGESSALTVYEGEAAYEGRGSALTVYPNQRADFRLDPGGAQYAITEAVADDFARWSGERDRDDDRAAASGAFASRWVSPEMTGAEDLDRNGRWEQDAEYGALWIPRVVPAGWAPYAAGRWTWVRPWGWTWVDDAPWGFAPFHYGRWLYRGSNWCWAPGSYVRRPVYAPALVVWLGGGGGRPDRPIERRDGRHPEPSIGWFPLAPREAYVPAYRASPRHARDVNGGHAFDRPRADDRRDPRAGAIGGGGSGDFRNRQAPNALTVLPESALLQRPPGGVPTAPWRQPRGGRDDERDVRNGRDGADGRRRDVDSAALNRIAEPVAALSTIAAPPAPLPLTSANRPPLRAEPGRPAWPRPGFAAARGGNAEDAPPQQQRPAPGGVPQPAAAATTVRSPAVNPPLPTGAPSVVRGTPAPFSNAAPPSPVDRGGLTAPAPNGLPLPNAPVRNGGLPPPPSRDRRADDAGVPRAVAPAVQPVAPAVPAASVAPAAPATTVTPAVPTLPSRPIQAPEALDGRGRDGFQRRDFPRADLSSPGVERRDLSQQRPDRGDDRRGDRADERRDGNWMQRRDDRRVVPGTAPVTVVPPVAPPPAVPLTAPPVAPPPAAAPPVMAPRPPAAAVVVPAGPLQTPAPVAPPPMPQPRPPRDASVRLAPPAPVAPAGPSPDEMRRAMPVNRAPPDDSRGQQPGATQREQRQSR